MLLVVLPLVSVAGTGCSSDDFACTLQLASSLGAPGPTSLCAEYGSAPEQASCVALGGTAASSCPTGDVLGSCEAHDVGSYTVTYYGSGEAVSTARDDCLRVHGAWLDP